MKKDFTKASEEHLVSIIKSVEPNNWIEKVGDWFGDIGLTISGWFGNLNINSYLSNIDEYHKKILDKNNITIKQLKKIFRIVRTDDYQYERKLQSQVKNTLEISLKNYVNELLYIMEPGKGRFNSNEMNKRLSSFAQTLDQNIKVNYKYIIYNDDDIHFGGNQGACYDEWAAGNRKDIRDIVRRHFPNYTDAQIKDLLYEMNNEGCNYTALANTIFSIYIGREYEFEKKFGFPMYDENGYPNYNLVMLDFYCSEGEIDGKEYGLTKETSESRWEHYMKEKGISVDVVNIDVDIDSFEEISKQGEIIVAISPLRLRNIDGKLVDTRNGGHAMVITAVVTINGKKMYRVSSWGDDYYIDPDDFSKNMRLEYQQVRY